MEKISHFKICDSVIAELPQVLINAFKKTLKEGLLKQCPINCWWCYVLFQWQSYKPVSPIGAKPYETICPCAVLGENAVRETLAYIVERRKLIGEKC